MKLARVRFYIVYFRGDGKENFSGFIDIHTNGCVCHCWVNVYLKAFEYSTTRKYNIMPYPIVIVCIVCAELSIANTVQASLFK